MLKSDGAFAFFRDLEERAGYGADFLCLESVRVKQSRTRVLDAREGWTYEAIAIRLHVHHIDAA